MNRYKIRLYPEQAKRQALNLENTLPCVKEVAHEYSEKGYKAANKKWIDEDSIIITGDTIQLVLASDAWLEFPTKAIRSFISELSKRSPYADLVTPSGRLFKGSSELLTEKIAQGEELSDEQTLIEVTKLFFRQTTENKKKINKIKVILGRQSNV